MITTAVLSAMRNGRLSAAAAGVTGTVLPQRSLSRSSSLLVGVLVAEAISGRLRDACAEPSPLELVEIGRA